MIISDNQPHHDQTQFPLRSFFAIQQNTVHLAQTFFEISKTERYINGERPFLHRKGLSLRIFNIE
jgi:hypothetical protein